MAYVIDGGAYYARVLDPRTYGAITQDVLSRHLHPLVVDSKLLCPKSSYTFQSFNRYFDQDVQVALNTTVSNNSMLGKYTKVGTNSHIETSTIGEKCVIGKNVKMTNCYLWNNVEIQDGCELSNVIIADGVVVKKGAKIQSGSLISYGIIVREGVTVPAGTMASKYTFNSESLAFEKSKVTSSDLFENGVISYIPRECQLGKGENLGDPKPFDDEEDSDFEDDDDADEENDREEFRREVRHTLDRCVKNKFSIQNAIMEVKNLKMTYNMDYPDCIEASYPVLLDLVGQMEGAEENAKRAKHIQTTFTEWKPFFKDFVREHADQFTLMREAEIYSAHHQLFQNSFHIIVQVLFTQKVLSADVVKEWNSKAEQSVKDVKAGEEPKDDTSTEVTLPLREKFIKDVSPFNN